jgi:hypothetical protein
MGRSLTQPAMPGWRNDRERLRRGVADLPYAAPIRVAENISRR